MNEKQVFNENARIRKFCDQNEIDFVNELSDENNNKSYLEIFDKYNILYSEFANKHNSDQRNLYTKIDPKAFEEHFKPVENTHKTKFDILMDEMFPSIIDWSLFDGAFWFSIKLKEKCLFSRREGLSGMIIGKHSVRLRLFGNDII